MYVYVRKYFLGLPCQHYILNFHIIKSFVLVERVDWFKMYKLEKFKCLLLTNLGFSKFELGITFVLFKPDIEDLFPNAQFIRTQMQAFFKKKELSGIS